MKLNCTLSCITHAALFLTLSALGSAQTPTSAFNKDPWPAPKKGPVKVFILAGQSNMQGVGHITKGEVGKYYRLILADVSQALDNLAKHYPIFAGQGYELAGFFWHQGWNDGCNKEYAQEYEKNMIRFIKDIRKDLAAIDKKSATGEELPLVIASSGMGGPDVKATTVSAYIGKVIEPAQMAAAQKSPNCAGVPTRHFQRHKPGTQLCHWHNSAESYVLVGDASAKAMIELLKKK